MAYLLFGHSAITIGGGLIGTALGCKKVKENPSYSSLLSAVDKLDDNAIANYFHEKKVSAKDKEILDAWLKEFNIVAQYTGYGFACGFIWPVVTILFTQGFIQGFFRGGNGKGK